MEGRKLPWIFEGSPPLLGVLSLGDEAVLLQLVVQGGRLDAQEPGRLRLHPASLLIRPGDELALDVLEDVRQGPVPMWDGQAAGIRARRVGAQVPGQVRLGER